MKNGKKICETLKQIRLDIARANEIEYTPCECNHEDDCAGTCPACENELMYLEQEISKKRSSGKAAVVGICLGLASLSLTSCKDTDNGTKDVQGSIPASTERSDLRKNIVIEDTLSDLSDNSEINNKPAYE